MNIMVKFRNKALSTKITSSEFQNKIFSLIFSLFILTFYFIYFLQRINPQLVYEAQQPVFFFDKHFADSFLSYPGGIIELISGFFSQFFYYSWTGSFLLVIVFGLIAWNTKLLIRSVDTDRPVIFLQWIPSILLLAMHSDYRFPLIFSLGLLLALFIANISIRLGPENKWLRLLFYMIIQAITYYLIGGQVFIFSAIIVFSEVLYNRRVIQPLIFLIFSGLLPYVGASYLFIMNIKDAYTENLTFYNAYRVTWLSYALYVFFPFVLALCRIQISYVGRRKKTAKKSKGIVLYFQSILMRFAQAIIFLTLIGLPGFYSYNRNAKAFLTIDYYAHFRKWDKILDMAQKGVPLSNIVQCQINRAYYHCDCLSDMMFGFPQIFGGNGLFMDEKLRASYSLQHSDVFFELGLINISEQWAYEAISANGDTGWNLQRLVTINLLKGNNEIAAKYLKMLRKTLWHRKWAIEHEKYLSDRAQLWTNPIYQHYKDIMPETNFLVSPAEPHLSLEKLLNNPKNKMAFEYFMAYCLLEGQINQFMKHIHLLNDFHYMKIPRHFEEAILVYDQLTGGKAIAALRSKVSTETVQKFTDYNRIAEKYNRNKLAARRELEKYNDTYWYYGWYYFQEEDK